MACGLVVALAAVACVRAPRPTGYFDNYATLVRQRAPVIGVFAERTVPKKQTRPDHVLQLLPSRWDAQQLSRPSRETELLELLDFRLDVYLQRFRPASVIVTQSRDVESLLNVGANVTQLRLSVTHIRKGIGLFRLLLPAFNLGATEFQVEGELVDYRTQRVVARLARRAIGNGAVFGLPTPQSLSSRFCWRLSIDETARMAALYVILQLNPPPPQWWKKPASPAAAGEGKRQK